MTNSSIKIHPLPNENNNGKEPIQKEVGQLSLDIFHTDKEIIILAPIAGVKQEDIHLSITEDVLVIKGERPTKYEAPEDDYYTKECFWGKFSRSIVLPLEAETNKISASFEDSILEIHIPKSEKKHTQVIKIKA